MLNWNCSESIKYCLELRTQNKTDDNESEIESLFENNWSKWMTDLTPVIPLVDVTMYNLNNEIKLALIESPHFNTIIHKDRLNLLETESDYSRIGNLQFKLGEDHYIMKDNINNTEKKILRTFSSMLHYLVTDEPKYSFSLSTTSEVIEHERMPSKVRTFISQINEACQNYLTSLPTNGNFNKIYVITLINVVVGETRTINNEQSHLVSNSVIEYSDLFIYEYAFYQCCKAVTLFEQMQKTLERQCRKNSAWKPSKKSWQTVFIRNARKYQVKYLLPRNWLTFCLKELKILWWMN